MKKTLVLIVVVFLLTGLAGIGQAWQGRMRGMNEPYGLLEDESDFLIHPAKIAKGEGVKYYGDYRFNYTHVEDWDYDLDMLTPAGALMGFYNYDGSGEEYNHNSLLGAAFPLGPGRMGVFFTYDGSRGDYDGNEDLLGLSNFVKYDLNKDLNNFALRLLYGLPICGFNVGGELQFAYRQEENENAMPGHLNYTLGTALPMFNLTPFQLPYDSKYWEALFKGSIDGKLGLLDIDCTVRGGFIFGGDDTFKLTQNTIYVHDSSGDVTGWRIGGDMGARYPLAEDLSLPFLVRVDYDDKTRDGTGTRTDGAWYYPYKSHEKNLHLTAGGGVDKELCKGARIAAGIYYNYLQGDYDYTLKEALGGAVGQVWDHSDYPDSSEHQVMLRLAGELEVSPAVTLRMGLAPFYGWVKEDFKFNTTSYTDDISPNGYHWGIGASLGGTIKLKPITLEPFVNFGYQKTKLDDNGDRKNSVGTTTNLWDMDKSRNEWSIGGGFSVLFDL